MEYIKIGETVTSIKAMKLCKYFGFVLLHERIKANSLRYKPWEFTGASIFPDKLMAKIMGVSPYQLTYKCALPHAIRYAYGLPGDRDGRKSADLMYKRDLVVKAGVPIVWAWLFYWCSRIFGIQKLRLPFSWSFARKSI